jgi:thiamine biosynthesis lipoprotein
MKQTRVLMGMPVSVEVIDPQVTPADLAAVYDYFTYVDEKFSTYKDTSEISAINRGELTLDRLSSDMRTIFALAEQTREDTHGYFDIRHNGVIDPSGIVKGWAIYHAAEILQRRGFKNYYVDAGGDVEVAGHNDQGQSWRIGIRNPFQPEEFVKIVGLNRGGIATSGTYIRGQHIYNPYQVGPITDIMSISVIGPNVYEADRYATAAFAMGRDGITFIENLAGFEGYLIDQNKQATLTSGFAGFVIHA